MGIKANDLDHDLKNFKKEVQTIATVEAEELTNYLHASQDDALASGTTAERVKKFFDFMPLHVFLPWLQELTEALNTNTGDTETLSEDLTNLDSGLSTLKTEFETHLEEAEENKQDIDAALALKADTEAVNAALALKADTEAVNTALELKADTATVNAALSEKADSAAVKTWQNQLVFTDAIEQAAATAILRATGDDSSKKVFLMVKSTGRIYNVSAQEVLATLSGQGSLTPVWGGELAATLAAAKAYADDLIGGIENGSY